jgi:hypothetical protein
MFLVTQKKGRDYARLRGKMIGKSDINTTLYESLWSRQNEFPSASITSPSSHCHGGIVCQICNLASQCLYLFQRWAEKSLPPIMLKREAR